MGYPAAAKICKALFDEPQTGDDVGEVLPLDGYRVNRVVGQGGGGRVYRAFRDNSPYPVAVKVLACPLGQGNHTARMWRELEVQQSLRLPCVARLLDHKIHDGRVYLISEFIEGESLAAAAGRLRGDSAPDSERKAALRTCVEVLATACDAVQAVHERGVIHRDVKPSNIMLTPAGDVVLVDFGLASLVEDATHTLTTDGAPLGTPEFMAPEQARGDRAAISTRTDVYGLGATAFWVLTGHAPHAGDCSLHEAVRRAASEPARDPREVRQDLPKPLAAVIAKACASLPQQRYGSAGELAADLRRWTRGEPVTAVAPGVWHKALRWAGKHPALATAGICALVGVAILVTSIAIADAVVRFKMSQPAQFVAYGAEDAWRRATLVSRGGNELAVIGGQSSDDVVLLATVFESPAGVPGLSPGQQVAAIAVFSPGKAAGTRGQVWVCDPKDLTTPLFAGPVIHTPPPAPDGYANFTPQPVAMKRVIQADVYAEVPGPEFIVIGDAGTQSANVIFVQDLRGNVLFEAWHFGHLNDAEWWPEHRLLVVTGDRHGQQTHQWAQVDHPEAQLVAKVGVNYPYPRMVFGVRLDLRGKHGWLRDSRDAAPDDPGRPLAWYKTPWPPRGTAMFNYALSRPPHDVRPEAVLELQWNCCAEEFPAILGSGKPLPDALDDHAAAWKSWVPSATRWDGSWSMYIDARGNVIGTRADRPDGWKRNFTDGEEGAKRAEGVFTLVDFPTGVEGWKGLLGRRSTGDR